MDAKDLPEEQFGRAIIQAALTVHTALGPGLLESVYQLCLAHELSRNGIPARKQIFVPITYADLHIEKALRIDLLVGDRVVVEIKSIESVLPVHKAQLLSYLRLAKLKLGYLLNFNVAHMRQGIVRLVNGL